MQLLAAFILGVIFGITLFNLLISPELDQLLFEREELKSTIDTQETKLNKLEESLAQARHRIIQNLEIKLPDTLDKHLKQKLKQDIFELLKSLIGREIKKIDGSLLAETLDNRIVIVEKKNYQLDLNWFIIKNNSIFSFEIIEKK